MNLFNITCQFPNFPISEIPAFPEGMMIDTSYGNDETPSFALEDKTDIKIYVGRERPEDRLAGAPRFNVFYESVALSGREPACVYSGNDFETAMWYIMKLDEITEGPDSAMKPTSISDMLRLSWAVRTTRA